MERAERTRVGHRRAVTHCFARNRLRALFFRTPSMTWRCRYTNTAPRKPQQILRAGVVQPWTPPPALPAAGRTAGGRPPFPPSCRQRFTLIHFGPTFFQLGPSAEAAPRPRAADPTDPMMAKAGSSCRSKGKSIRKLVLNRAVMVTVGWKGQASRWERHRNPGGSGSHQPRVSSFLPPGPPALLPLSSQGLCLNTALLHHDLDLCPISLGPLPK